MLDHDLQLSCQRRLAGPIGVADVIAAYVDNAAAEPAVAAAVEVVDLADLGDEDAELTVGDAQDHDLAWYATQELGALLEFFDVPPDSPVTPSAG